DRRTVPLPASARVRQVARDRRRTTTDRTRTVPLAARPVRADGGTGARREHAVSMVVVGVDHSDGAKAALRFALEEARLRQATLRAVHAWQYAYVGAPGIERALTYGGADAEAL